MIVAVEERVASGARDLPAVFSSIETESQIAILVAFEQQLAMLPELDEAANKVEPSGAAAIS